MSDGLSRRSSTRSSPDRVATITLNRPDVLNAFDRADVRGDALGLAADQGRPGASTPWCCAPPAIARSAPGSTSRRRYGQPDDVWNHEDPGELLSPKWQKVWKPVVCAVQGICTAGAFYFVNESDIVICSPDATFFDSHVTYGMVSALEPVGLMRRIGLGETLRMALIGQRRARRRRDRAAHRARDRDRRARPSCGRARTSSPPRSRPSRPPPRRARCARSGSRSTGRTAPRWSRACIYTRARQPDRHGRGRREAARRARPPRIR